MRTGQYRKPRDPFSQKAALARDLVARNRPEDALEVLDRTTLSSAGKPNQLAKIAALVGDQEVKKGRYENAIRFYRRAANHFAGDDPREWFRPRLAEIICLTKSVNADDAWHRAKESWDLAIQKQSAFDHLKKAIPTKIKKGEIVKIPSRPIRPSVVGSKIGQAFLQEGEPDMARWFFEKAIEGNPKGGCRARQGLATLALRSNNYAEAEKRATEALLVGKFQAKTVSAWSLLIEARQNLGKRGLDREHFGALRSIENDDIRSRSILQIARELRTYGDPQWRRVANLSKGVSGKNSAALDLQIDRLLLADGKLVGDQRETRRLALRILSNSSSSPNESISALGAYAASLQSEKNQKRVARAAIRRIESRWGPRVADRALQTVGTALALNGEPTASLAFFQEILVRRSEHSSAWGRAVVALADTEKSMGNTDAAKNWRYRYFANPSMPSRYRVQSLLEWLELSEDADPNESVDTQNISTAIQDLVREISDYQTLLDIGRDLSLRGSQFRSIRDQVISQGVEAAEQAMADTENPSLYNSILVKLTRREFSDFRITDSILARWNRMDARTRLWLWSEKSDYWEYLSLVLKSYVYERRYSEADAFATGQLEDTALPEIGHAYIASSYAFSLIAQERFAETLELYRDFAQRHPTHRLTAQAYYWLFVHAYIEGQMALAQGYALSLAQCFGNKTHFLWEDQLLIRVALTEAGQNITEAAFARAGFDEEDIKREKMIFQRDRERMERAL